MATEVAESGVRKLVATGNMQTLGELVGSATLIVIDNASDAFDANENDRRQVRAFIRMLAQIARKNDAGFLLLAHIDKDAAKNGARNNSYSGSTGWHNGPRSRLALVEDHGKIELKQEKLNIGKMAPPTCSFFSTQVSTAGVSLWPNTRVFRSRRD